jgi:hypothetical protein
MKYNKKKYYKTIYLIQNSILYHVLILSNTHYRQERGMTYKICLQNAHVIFILSITWKLQNN